MAAGTFPITTQQFYGGPYQATWNGVYIGAVADGFYLNYDQENTPFETDATGRTTIGHIRNGVNLTIEFVLQNYFQGAAAPTGGSGFLYAAVGGEAKMLAPLLDTGNDVYTLAQQLVLTPILSTTIDPLSLTLNKTINASYFRVNLNSDLRQIRVTMTAYPNRSNNMIFGTLTPGTV